MFQEAAPYLELGLLIVLLAHLDERRVVDAGKVPEEIELAVQLDQRRLPRLRLGTGGGAGGGGGKCVWQVCACVCACACQQMS